MQELGLKGRCRRRALAANVIAGLIGTVACAMADTATFNFAQVGSSFSAFLPSDDPLVGKEVVSARIYLDVETFPGSDAMNFFTDLSFPIEPLPGNENAIVLTGSDLGWSGSGTFHHFEETTRFNGVFVSARYGGETPGENFDGLILDTSRIEFDYLSTGDDLTLESAVARKNHGGAGVFAVDLPLSGDFGIESRSARQSRILFKFNNNVTSVTGVTSTCGPVGVITVDPADSHNVLVKLGERECDQSNVTLTLTGVIDDQGNTLDSASVTLGILFGDVTGDSKVNDADLAAVEALQGQETTAENFRADINADGVIDSSDVSRVRNYRGNRLP